MKNEMIGSAALLLCLVYATLIIDVADCIPHNMISFHDQDYSRFARSIVILPMPPPILPPPINNTCTAACGSDGLRVLNTDTCQCVCARGIPATCPSQTPRASSTRTKKTNTTQRRRERSHKTKSRTQYYGCPEYTKNGKLKKPRKPRKSRKSRSHSKSDTVIPSPTTSLCPIGQVIDPITCQCSFQM